MFNRSIYTLPFIGLISANMFFWMSVNFFLPVLPIYYHSLGMNDHQVGLAIGAYSLGAVLFRFPSGKAVDRWGSRRVITVGIFFSIIAIIGYYFSMSPVTATISRFLHGVGISGYSAAALTMVTLMQDERNTTQAVAVYTLFTMFGIGIAASSAGWLFKFGEMPLVIVAGILATALSLVLFPMRTQVKMKAAQGESLPFLAVAKNPGILIPTISLAAANMCYGSIMTFLPLLMLSQGIVEFNIFYVAYAVAVVFTRFWVGRLCERFASERLTFFVLLLLAATMLAAGGMNGPWALLLSGAGIGAGYGLAFPVMATTITANTQPANRGSAFGFFTTAVDVGFAAGAIAMGAVAAAWGYRAVFVTAGLYTAAYALLHRAWLLSKLDPKKAAA